jgi:hypothetical protein
MPYDPTPEQQAIIAHDRHNHARRRRPAVFL